VPGDIQTALLSVFVRGSGLTAAGVLDASSIQSSSGVSWVPAVTGAVGVVLGACVAGFFAFASSWYTLRNQRAQLFNQRLTAAAELLGNVEAATRLAGVYALAGLADEWKEQQQVCVDVLCGYMRFRYEPKAGADGYREGEREVRLSLVRIIRDHLRDNAAVSWQGRIFRFHRATFDGGDLSHVRMAGGYMSFYDANFVSGSLDFRGAKISEGAVDFQEAKFSGGGIDFRYAKFSGGIVKFPDSVFSDGVADFRNATFSGGKIELAQAIFSGGIVDLREPRENSVPPSLPDPVPSGIRLANPAPIP
jgi:uncharacterized protein YjbI with pentapeptide repeats